jgi:hypothetical protein
VSDSYFSVTPFSATQNCGEYANTWTYTGYDNSDAHALNQATDLIEVDSTNGKIFVSKYKPPGKYEVKIIGILPEDSINSAVFTILIKNTAPVFLTSVSDLIVPLMSNFSLPGIFDPDLVDNITVTVKNSAD